MMLVKVGQVEDNLLDSAAFDMHLVRLTSGIKPPWRVPRRARYARNDVRPSMLNCAAETRDQSTI